MISTTSFDIFVLQGCTPILDQNDERAKSLSIRDIGDWSDVFEVVHREPTSDTARGSYLGLINFLSYIEPIQTSLVWSKRRWSRRLGFAQRRTLIWRLVVAQTRSPDPSAFTLPTPCGFSTYTLTPKSPPCPSTVNVPLQQLHTSPLAIPPELADESCTTLAPDDILLKLNTILGTNRVMDAELASCIDRCIQRDWDLGTTYGHLRLWWRLGDNFSSAMRQIGMRREDWELKFGQPPEFGSRLIHDPWTYPPRRVWDLYSNRVLPSYLLVADERRPIPSRVWAISHCWVPDNERQDVWTSINGHEWPVPIPVDTSLDHIRIELLNLGAEYVFLDVLCLRQQGDSAFEQLRQEEWKIDVPILMNVYQRPTRDQTTVIYFNGLGRPLDMNRAKLDSPFHWFQRSWTLQETTEKWLPGGLTDPILGGSANGPYFMDLMRRSIEDMSVERRSFMDLVYAFQSRPGVAAKKAHDRVAALSYLILHSIRMQYDSMPSSADEVWKMLIQELLKKFPQSHLNFLDLLVRCPSAGMDNWIPPWHLLISTVQNVPRPSLGYNSSDLLKISKDPRAQCESPAIDYIFHEVYVLNHLYRTHPANPRTIEIFAPQPSTTGNFSSQSTEQYILLDLFTDLPPGEAFTLVGLSQFECWIVGVNMGEQLLHGLESPPGGPAMLLKKITVGRINSPAARRKLQLDDLELGGYCNVAYWTTEMSCGPSSRKYYDNIRWNMRQGRRDGANRGHEVKSHLKWRQAMDEQRDY